MTSAPTLLCVLDGFGLNPNPRGNAVYLAKKPTFDRLWTNFPRTTLTTFGEAVGLPAGQMGNSEVGHLNIGAGRVVEQWLLRISRSLAGKFLSESAIYRNFITQTKSSKALHLVGLFSDGGVHSHSEHLYLLIKRLRADFQGKIVLHLITDGRDTSPNLSLKQIPELLDFMVGVNNCQLGTISGRYFAMDRDKRWDRTERAYLAIANGSGQKAPNVLEYIKDSYTRGVTDEFLEPAIVAHTRIEQGDGVVFWNFREDRMRQIVRALCVKDFADFSTAGQCVPAERTLCFTDYDHTFKLPYLFSALEIKNHLGEFVSNAGLKQLRVAETEKYAHVTYFFNGGIESPYPGEDRVMIPSPRDVKTYDLKPEMSAESVCQAILDRLKQRIYDLIVVNFANCDMVGHTGVVEAAAKAVETVDGCLGRIMTEIEKQNGKAVILADHGNADQMINYEDGSPHTAHTMHPVPFIATGVGPVTLKDGGALCDVAPTLLKMMGLPQPTEMSGKALY